MFKTTVLLVAVSCGLMAQTMDRTKAPVTPPAPDYKLPPFSETTLPNGLHVVLLDDQRFPLVTVRLGFAAGQKYDPKELPGLAEATAALLTEGTRTRPARQLAEELAAIGGGLHGVVDSDSLIITGNALSEQTGKLLNLLADVARNASFPDDEIALRKQNRKQMLETQKSNPSFLANRQFAKAVFGAHPYSVVAPTPEAIDKLDRKVLAQFQATYLVPNNAVLILLGKLPSRADAEKMIAAEFGSWQRKTVPPGPKAQFPAAKREIVLVDRPGSAQADIHVGRIAITRADPDYVPMRVAAFALGGGASSRMFNTIREKEGFAYDAHAELAPRKDSGSFAAVTEVRNEVLEPALHAVIKEMSSMGSEPPAGAELMATQNYINGIYLLSLQTQNGLATQLISTKMMGLPNSFLEKYTANVRAVKTGQLRDVARKYMSPDDAAIVVVGDASKIKAALDKFGTVTVVKAD